MRIRRSENASVLESKERVLLQEWGEYTQACRRFAKKLQKLAGVRAVGTKYHGDYVDLWIIADETHQMELIRPVGEVLKEVWRHFPDLYFDSFVTHQELPPDFTVFFSASGSHSLADHAHPSRA